MPARRVNPYRVKLHRPYSVQELAECLGVHKNTVRHWQGDGLQAIDGNRPTLFEGAIARAFLLARQTSRKRPWTVAAQQAVRMADDGKGAVLAVIAPDAPDDVKREVAKAIEPLAPGAIEAVERHIVQTEAAKSPAARGVPFVVPKLQIMVQSELDLAYSRSARRDRPDRGARLLLDHRTGHHGGPWLDRSGQ